MKHIMGKGRTQTRTRVLQSGLTILELLLSMALGVALMAGISQVFVGMRQTDRTVEVASRMQEAGRFALTLLGRELRTSSYLGCSSTVGDEAFNTILATIPASFQPRTGVQGWEADGTGTGDTNNSGTGVAVESASSTNTSWDTSGGNILPPTNVVPDSDILRVWNVDPGIQGTVLSVIQGVTPSLSLSDMDIAVGDILLLSDCEFIDIVQACSIAEAAGPPVTLTVALSTTCSPGNAASSQIVVGAGASVSKLNGTLYYVGKRNNTAANPPSLFRRTLGNNALPGTTEELVEGVESMQLLYGENSDNDFRNTADRFVTADLVTDWTNVVSVRMELLVQSVEDNLAPAPQPYTFHGLDYDGAVGNGDLPEDKRLRRVFTTTVNLRNRTL
jgi:type IV pilus assembly protein PilW